MRNGRRTTKLQNTKRYGGCNGNEMGGTGFINLKKAYSTVPREMVMTALMWMCVPQSEVTMVEGTYEETKHMV